MTGLHARAAAPGARAVIAGGELRVGALRVDLATRRARYAPQTRGRQRPLTCAGALARGAPPARRRPPASLAPACARSPRATSRRPVRELAGRGEGLTPAGTTCSPGYAA